MLKVMELKNNNKQICAYSNVQWLLVPTYHLQSLGVVAPEKPRPCVAVPGCSSLNRTNSIVDTELIPRVFSARSSVVRPCRRGGVTNGIGCTTKLFCFVLRTMGFFCFLIGLETTYASHVFRVILSCLIYDSTYVGN